MRHDLSEDDVLRLITSTFSKALYYQRTGEGYYPPCKDYGEILLLDALEYLAWGDTANARRAMASYEDWLATGALPWGFHGFGPPADA